MNNKKADYLISLVGTNPLPSFITILKNCTAASKVFLIYTNRTENNIGTFKLAESLSNVIKGRIHGIEIYLVESDKSNIGKIKLVTEDIIKSILRIGSENDKKRRVVLDYSSGTKAMSAIFYNRLNNLKIENLEIITSYLDDNSENLIENINFHEENRIEIKDIVRNHEFSIEDITMIHGYKLEDNSQNKIKIYKTGSGCKLYHLFSGNGINFINNNNLITVDAVFLLNERLYIYYISKGEESKKGKYKIELFILKDEAEKLGGSRSGIIYKCEANKNIVNGLKKDLKGAYEYEMDRRLKILGKNDSFESWLEDIKQFY